MAPFVVPAGSLSRRYAQALRRVTWKKIRTPQGVKVLPPIRNQIGRTCIYEAFMGWLESHLRLKGIVVRLSSKDLEEKEQALMTEEDDRTSRCFIVLGSLGVRSEYDYENEIMDGVVYVLTSYEQYFSLYKPHMEKAVEAMCRGPLFLVFNCDESYFKYLKDYESRPIYSYKEYNHEQIMSHAANSTGYSVEGIVPCWDFMNSYGKRGVMKGSKGFGRVLVQNAVRLFGLPEIQPIRLDG